MGDDFVYLALGGKLRVRVENVSGVMLVRCRSENVDRGFAFDLLPHDAHALADLIDECGSQAEGLAAADKLDREHPDG